jgi:hypothetical protein
MSSTTKVLVVVLVVHAVLLSIREIRMVVPSLNPSAHSGAASEVVSSTSYPQQEQHHLDPSRVHHSGSTISSFNHKTFDSIVNQTNQVFITMPCKAAGMTMQRFSQRCMNDRKTNMFPRDMPRDSIITGHYKMPSIFQGWLKSDKQFVDLVKGATRETLILHFHREELSRIRSAIQHVLVNHICGGNSRGIALKTKYEFDVELVDQNRCIIDEEHLVSIIKGRENEIGYRFMTCNFFDGIAQNNPSNLVFVHYKQAGKLQHVLAKHHCPHILKDLPITENVASDKVIQPFIRLKSKKSSREVTFTEWFDNKKNVILWAYDIKSYMDCQSKIKDMEDQLFSCPDEAVTLFRGEYQCVSLS